MSNRYLTIVPDGTPAPDELPDYEHATLPQNYEAAKVALAACAKVDECKAWADKTAALASYARQCADEELEKMAMRIRARAIRKCGELLKEFQAQKGKRTDLQPGGGTPTRFEHARKAGMSKDKAVTAIRVASVPAQEFEAAVESDNPPTVTELAERGTKHQPVPLTDLGGISPDDYKAATRAMSAAHQFMDMLAGIDPAAIARGVKQHEGPELLSALGSVSDLIGAIRGALKSNADMNVMPAASTAVH